MTAQEITAAYALLHRATVKLDLTLERGPGNLTSQLETCRQLQDEVSMLQVTVLRAFAGVKQGRRTARMTVRLLRDQRQTNTPTFEAARTEHDQLESLFDELEALRDSCAVARMNLRATDSDIRLAAELLRQQLHLGAVTPPRDTPAPSVATVFEPAPEAVDLSALFKSET